MDCLSHPDKKLIDHLNNVKKIGLSVFNNKNLNLPEEFKTVLELILFYHDIGKSTIFFQDYLKNSIENKDCSHSTKLTAHALFSATIGAYKIFNSVKNNPYFWTILGFNAIRKHHGNLKDIQEMVAVGESDWRNIKTQRENIHTEFQEKFKDINFYDIKVIVDELLWEKDDVLNSYDYFFLQNLLFSILIYADKNEVVLGKCIEKQLPETSFDIVSRYKKQKFINDNKTELNRLREDAYIICEFNAEKFSNNNIFSINLPTGSGKTLTVLNTAFTLLKNDKSLKRIIYTLPFISIIDQTEKILNEILEKNNLDPKEYLTVHHHLAEPEINIGEENLTGDRAQFVIENWDTPIVLTTFWQFFHSIITGDNANLRKFHNIANSVIILDEIQSMPYKYWELVRVVLISLTELLNCKFILLTATMPLIFEPEETIELVPDNLRKDFFSQFKRYKIENINNLDDITIDELAEKVYNDIEENPDKSFLFVFNTIRTSIEFFERLRDLFPDKDIIYLSTNILPIERKKRIKEIKKNPIGKIIVSTQLIEAGVDIDIDIVYRDFAPLDSIVQTAGRCNRNNKKGLGIVKLFKLKNDNDKYDYSYIYSGLLINATLKALEEKKEIFENKLLEIIDKYYNEVKNTKSNNESNKILDAMKNLNYVDVKENFKLIDNSNTFPLFIEYNDEASELLRQFREISKIEDNFERKAKFLEIKSRFYQYVLSVRLTNETKSYYTMDDNAIKIITKDLKDSIYNDSTGLVKNMSVFI